MSTNNDIEVLSTCTNLSLIDKINEIINKLNTPEAFVVEATDLQKHIIASGTNPNYKCKLTIITENKSILIFSIICSPAMKGISPIFVESVTNEFSNLGTFLYFGETSNDLILKYNKKCTVLIDGAIGDYVEFNPNTTGAENYIVDTKPAEWGFYVPNEVVKASGDNGEWLTLNKTYNNDGMEYQFIIGVNKSAIMNVVNNLRDELMALIDAINEEIGDRYDRKSGGFSIDIIDSTGNVKDIRFTNGGDTCVFGIESNLIYCDGYAYIGDNYNWYLDGGGDGAYYQHFKTTYPDTYINKDTQSKSDSRNFYKFEYDKNEFLELLTELGIGLLELSSESQLPDYGSTPTITEIEIAPEGKDTIWANINDLYNRDQSTQNQISTINNDIAGINTSLTNITQDISNLSSTVIDHSDAIGELQTDVQTLDTALEGAIDKNTEQDDRLDNLESRMETAEGRLDGIDVDLNNLKGKLAYTVEMNHNKEYTCIASVEANLDGNNVVPFSVEYDVVTDKNDELQFIVTDNAIKLINLTNQSYTSFNTNNELLISEKITGDTVKYNIYLKRYDSNNDTQVSVALINFIDCNIISYSETSKNRADFTTNYSALDCDADFLRNIDPVIKYGTDIQNFSDGMDRVGDQNSKYGRVIKIPQPTSMHTLTVHDKSKSSSASGYETQFDGSQDKTVDALSKVNTTQGGGLSGDGTSSDPLKVDSVDTQFDSTQFDITPGQTASDPTIISIKSNILGKLKVFYYTIDNNNNVTITDPNTLDGNNQPVTLSPSEMYNTISPNESIVLYSNASSQLSNPYTLLNYKTTWVTASSDNIVFSWLENGMTLHKIYDYYNSNNAHVWRHSADSINSVRYIDVDITSTSAQDSVYSAITNAYTDAALPILRSTSGANVTLWVPSDNNGNQDGPYFINVSGSSIRRLHISQVSHVVGITEVHNDVVFITFDESSTTAQDTVYNAIADAYNSNKLPILQAPLSGTANYWLPTGTNTGGYLFYRCSFTNVRIGNISHQGHVFSATSNLYQSVRYITVNTSSDQAQDSVWSDVYDLYQAGGLPILVSASGSTSTLWQLDSYGIGGFDFVHVTDTAVYRLNINPSSHVVTTSVVPLLPGIAVHTTTASTVSSNTTLTLSNNMAYFLTINSSAIITLDTNSISGFHALIFLQEGTVSACPTPTIKWRDETGVYRTFEYYLNNSSSHKNIYGLSVYGRRINNIAYFRVVEYPCKFRSSGGGIGLVDTFED